MANKSTLVPWIDAFQDNQADLQSFSSCMTLADLNSDNDHKLILADFGNGTQIKLKVYRGTFLATEIPLLSAPSAVKTIYTDRAEPRIPGIIVATGNNVLVYRNCRPYFKFTLPSQECSSLEADMWQQKSHTTYMVHLLQELAREIGFSNMSAPSQHLLTLEPAQRDEFLSKYQNFSLKKQMVITCVTTMNKTIADDRDISCLLLATESAQLFILDPETFTLITTFNLPSVAYLMCASGIYMVDYLLILVGRNSVIYSMVQGVITYITQMPTLPVAALLIGQSIVTANMDSTLQCYTPRGRKQWSTQVPGDIQCMTAMPLIGLALNLVAISLSNGSILLYNGPNLIHSFLNPSPISAMVFGKYGQEEHALVTVAASGAIGVKLLKRTAQFSSVEKSEQPQVRPHDIKLLIPKKSKLIVEQTIRERQQSREMHLWFQKSWMGLNVMSSEAYLTALQNAVVSQKESLKLTVQVVGLGPRMKLLITLESMNFSSFTSPELAVTFLYDPRIYKLHSPLIPVPLLVAGVPCNLETYVTCLLPVTAIVQVIVVSSIIVLSANVNMPPSAPMPV